MRTELAIVAYVTGVVAISSTLVSSAQSRANHHIGYRHDYYLHHGVADEPFVFCGLWWCQSAVRTGHIRTLRSATEPFRDHERGRNSVGLGDVNGTLAAKASEIVAGCASSVISGFRRGAHIAGSGHASLHASGRAVDIRGNPRCIYAQLQGWPGGYSVDYGSVQHVHISLGGFEDGIRFAHYSPHHRRHSSHGGHHRSFALHHTRRTG
jgi:hypothetical protein